MKSWTIAAGATFLLALILAIVFFDAGALWWMAIGGALIGSLLVILFTLQEKAPSAPDPRLQRLAMLEQHAAMTETKAAEQIAAITLERDRLLKKMQEASDRSASHQRLVDVHRKEIETLKRDFEKMSNESLAKTRRITELELYLEDPKASPQADDEAAFLYAQLKQHAEEKDRLLEQTRAELMVVENRLLSLQKDVEEKSHDVSAHEFSLARQLDCVEEEKERLAGELFSVQEVVSELSQKKKKPPAEPKAKKSRKSIRK